MKKRPTKLFLAMILGMFWHPMEARTAETELPPLQTVSHVDLQRYLGKWYEIAKFPNRFQRGCDFATAQYSLRKDGDIKVVNQCIQEDDEHTLKTSIGKAWVVDPVSQAKLKVRFFWPFSGDYWIIDLDNQYEYAVISEPDREYLWILSRTPQLPESIYQGIIARLQEKGFDLSRLKMSRQM